MNGIVCVKKGRGKSEWMRKRPQESKFDEIADQPLKQVDIVAAIRYYGITELLDHIGKSEIERYLVENG